MASRMLLAAKCIILCFIIGCQFASPQQVQQQSPSSIKGVWAFESETNPKTGELIRDEKTKAPTMGFWVFTEKYHCLARMEIGREGLSDSELDELPLEKQVEYYRQLLRYVSNAGTYSVEDNTLRRQWQANFSPNSVDGELITTFSVEGDLLTVERHPDSAGSGVGWRVVYRRLE